MTHLVRLNNFILLAFLGITFGISQNAAAGECVNVNNGVCVVTNSSGGPSNGTFISCLRDERCQEIGFAVPVDPLQTLAEVDGGVTIDGQLSNGSRVELRYDQNYNWSTGSSYQNCLLRIIPLENSAEGVVIKNLNVSNPQGSGVCLKSSEQNSALFLNNNNFSDMIVQSGPGKAFDLAQSNSNTFENVHILGAGDGTESGIYIGGTSTTVTETTIENVRQGITVGAGKVVPLSIDGVDFLKIKDKAIYYPELAEKRPEELESVFVSASGFTLTGIVNPDTVALQLYAFENTAEGKNYHSRLSFAVEPFRDSNFTLLETNQKRFIHPIPASSGLAPNQTLVALAKLKDSGNLINRLTEFSDSSKGINPVAGNVFCNLDENRWFWYSYDSPGPNGERIDPWDVDYDGDSFDMNNVVQTNGREDLDKDCRMDPGETNPNDWRSQDDFDCDGRPDWKLTGIQRMDNCIEYLRDNCNPNPPPNPPNPPNPQDCEYQANDINAKLVVAVCNGVNNPANDDLFATWNPGQEDADSDGRGNPCEEDGDNDGFANDEDNCLTVFNPAQRDSDGDGTGDACERIWEPAAASTPQDLDGDGISNANDNCPGVANREQRDRDQDGQGDFCDFNQRNDADGDGKTNLLDNCPYAYNPDQLDRDDDKVGDLCDLDDDNDGLTDVEEVVAKTNPKHPDSDLDSMCDGPDWGFSAISCIRPLDNCPLVFNQEQEDQDEDGIGDACDAAPKTWRGEVDSDGDGVVDEVDNCPTMANATQNDNDSDTVGDPCDPDDDNDGLDDATESARFDPRLNDQRITTRPLHLEKDSDGDNYVDGVDVCPNYPNPEENAANPSGSRNVLPDSDCGRYNPIDIDNDGRNNSTDNCVFIPNRRQLDLDADGKGNSCDLDDDNDNSPNANDNSCWNYLRTIDAAAVSDVLARNTENCDSSLQTCLHCDFDESANFRLHPWDPNSDHEGGRIFNRPDFKCDGAGTGFGLPTAMTRCEPVDLCPEFFNPTGQEEGCPLAGSGGEDSGTEGGTGDEGIESLDADGDLVLDADDNCVLAVNPSQSDTDGDGLGDDCDPNPTSKNAPQIRGAGSALGGCMLVIPQNAPGTFFNLLKPLLKSVILAAWILRVSPF